MNRALRVGTAAAARPGVVLVITLLALVAIEAIALGVVFLATQETRVAAAHDRALRARLAAEAAAVDAWVGWRDAPAEPACTTEAEWPNIAVHATTTDGFSAEARVDPLAGRWLVARAAATDAGGVRFRTGLAFALADASAWLALFPAALAGGATGEAIAGLPLPGEPDGATAAARTLIDLADRGGSGELRVGSVVEDGRCAGERPFNWGAPLDRTDPCHTHVPVITIDGDARLTDGAGQGVLVVSGRFVLAAGTHFEGVVIVTGQLAVEPGATITGAVTVTDGGEARVDGPVTYSRCAVLRVLRGSRAAHAFGVAPAAVWLPLF